MSRYHVKWTDEEGTHYGIIRERDEFHKDDYKAVPKGSALVDDAIRPIIHVVPEKDLMDIPFGETYGSSEYDKHVEAEYEKTRALSDKLPERQVLVGAMFSIGVGDGKAYYVVTKVNKTTCDVEWRGFCPDRWTDHYFGWGRKRIAKSEVQRYLFRFKLK